MQQPEWKGATSQRFSGGRIHLKPQGEFNSLMQSNSVPLQLGVKTYSQKLSEEKQFKPCMKVFEDSYHLKQKQIDLRGVKYLTLPPHKQIKRKERAHVPGGLQTNNEIDPKGVKTFSHANKTKGQDYYIESKMQAKMRVLGLEGQRNGLAVTSLGDKPYNYPEYQSNFYKNGGLIAGSTGFRVRSGDSTAPDAAKLKSIFTKPMWAEKVKMEEKEQETRVLDSVDDWEQNTLKEANPKWNDPDTFFERMEKAGNAGKDVKKGNKK